MFALSAIRRDRCCGAAGRRFAEHFAEFVPIRTSICLETPLMCTSLRSVGRRLARTGVGTEYRQMRQAKECRRHFPRDTQIKEHSQGHLLVDHRRPGRIRVQLPESALDSLFVAQHQINDRGRNSTSRSDLCNEILLHFRIFDSIARPRPCDITPFFEAETECVQNSHW